MTVRELNLELINKFPELEVIFHNEVDWQEGKDTGSHVVYGDVLEPYIEKQVKCRNSDTLKKIFTFIEYLLSFEDRYIEEVVLFSILEKLNDNKANIEYCKPLMGKALIELYKEL